MKVDYQNKKIVIVGLGKTGISCIEFLKNSGAEICGVDTRDKIPNEETIAKDIVIFKGGLHQELLINSDILVVSPGISLRSPEIQKAIDHGVEVVGDIELFCRHTDKPIIAITGANGKSTVTMMTYNICKQAGLHVGLGGNIGVPALSLLNQNYDLFVLELSSFQLETTNSLHAKAATILNLVEDHMDRYTSFADYVRAKQKIYNNAETIIINADDELTMPSLQQSYSKQQSFGISKGDYFIKDDYLYAHSKPFIHIQELPFIGEHNYLNALATIGLTQALDIDDLSIKQGLKSYIGLDHRFQIIPTEDDITWINDSKATNVGSTVAALNGLKIKNNLHLLLGGDSKKADVSDLKKLLQGSNIFCYCFGQDKEILAELSTQSIIFNDMKEAMFDIKRKVQKGDTVLLSPACASTDQFSNFEERGRIFTSLVNKV